MSTDPPTDTPYTVAVRTLCEFTARQGDLNTRFTPGPTANQGQEGHRLVAARRPAHHLSEVPLEGRHRHLWVRGRADGFDPQAGRLEEVKTHRGDIDRLPPNHRQLHWAQAKVYAWLLCQQQARDRLEVALVYFDLDRQTETVLAATHTALELQAFFEALCERFLHWADQERGHRTRRDAALRTLAFPFGDFRAGQRELAEAVYRAHTHQRCLLAQAPTGIGKTLGTLFPALRALPVAGTDQLYALSAKTPGRQLMLDGLARLGELPLRTLELVARDKACEHPDKACHGDSCPLARGFYDRLPAARAAAVAAGRMDRAQVRVTALAHQICPYYLTQALVRWSDVVVGDYNHFFDPHAMLHALVAGDERSAALLVDEAHNLVERARGMYSAALDFDSFSAVRRQAPKGLKRAFNRLNKAWGGLLNSHDRPYQVLNEVPPDWMGALQGTVAAVAEHLAEQAAAPDGPLTHWYFDALHFQGLAESFGAHSLLDLSHEHHGSLNLRNVVPAPFLRERWLAARGATLFSATLSPPDFARELLGLPENSAWRDVPSPFAATQLRVEVARDISTRYSDRAQSLDRLVDRIARHYLERPGNYLAFFSSFDYQHQASERLAERHPHVPQFAQARGMSEAERQTFVDRFTPDSQGVGFAVLGGAFGEGIDLPGARLIGAFIATLGLPQVNPVNEQMRARLQALLGDGWRYTYLYPGLQKVAQAAGRVIRTPEDRGLIVLMDDRFGQAEVRALLPGWWPAARRSHPAP
ncbi:ATP-dependent DNA helicase [Hydrogenophaga sp. OTU3427]|uniref:ATP-dependent DNA helicase n=1 Tax=Hydrogenophaga sp. OTU3427 TaxID=3043856 RepID=UPI00313B463F